LANLLTANIVSVARHVLRTPWVWLFTYEHESARELYARHGFRTIEHSTYPPLATPASASAAAPASASASAASSATAAADEKSCAKPNRIEIMRIDFK
jgi:hypothetical protein